MGFRDAIHVIHNKEYIRAVEAYVIKQSKAVLVEESTVDNHVERVAFAKRILAGEVDLGTYAKAVGTDDDVLAEILNGGAYITKLEAAVNLLYDRFAGVST